MPVAAIYQKCNFRWLKTDELELDDNNPDTENDFHCGYDIGVITCLMQLQELTHLSTA